MDRPGSGDQYLTESDGGDKTFSDTGTLVGTGRKDEETKSEASERINSKHETPAYRRAGEIRISDLLISGGLRHDTKG